METALKFLWFCITFVLWIAYILFVMAFAFIIKWSEQLEINIIIVMHTAICGYMLYQMSPKKIYINFLKAINFI